MNITRPFSVLSFLILISFGSCAYSQTVVELKDDNFEHETQVASGHTTGKWFVMFYATWCSACKSLKPAWEELSVRVNDESLRTEGIVVAKVDAVKNQELAKRFSVRGYPMLVYFVEGTMYQYKGERSVEAMVDYLVKGYKSDSSGKPVPASPSWASTQKRKLIKKWNKMVNSNEHLSMLVDDFEHILEIRKNAAVVLLLMGSMVGLLVGLVLGRFTTKTTAKQKTA